MVGVDVVHFTRVPSFRLETLLCKAVSPIASHVQKAKLSTGGLRRRLRNFVTGSLSPWEAGCDIGWLPAAGVEAPDRSNGFVIRFYNTSICLRGLTFESNCCSGNRTFPGLGHNADSDSYLIGAVNNLLYFAWEECRAYKEGSVSKTEFKTLVDEPSLKKIRALLPAHKWDAFFDTSLRINWYHLGRRTESLEIATAIIDAIHDKVRRRSGKDPDYSQMPKVLTADEMDTYLHAVDIASRIARSTPKP